MSETAKRGHFRMRGYGAAELNVYDCSDCKAADRAHEIREIPAGYTSGRSHWGPGVPTHKRVCSGCGAEDGPWVSAKSVGGLVTTDPRDYNPLRLRPLAFGDRHVCTAEFPWNREQHGPRAVHPQAISEGGDETVSYRCPICGERWREELPQ